MNKLLGLFHGKPYLAWYVRDINKVSKKSLLEHILNYGDWEDYIEAEKSLGIKNAKEIFDKLKGGARTNLRKRTINYFDKYFQKYA